jgi:sialate O-acetylesterase
MKRAKYFSPAAEIKENKVILALGKNEKIIKVLYAFKPFTRANLENEAGLPASTFSIEIKSNKTVKQ